MGKENIKLTKEFGAIVRVSSILGFSEWLGGQTRPYVESMDDPYDWAFASDFCRFYSNLPLDKRTEDLKALYREASI